jgi:hypothetical protein
VKTLTLFLSLTLSAACASRDRRSTGGSGAALSATPQDTKSVPSPSAAPDYIPDQFGDSEGSFHEIEFSDGPALDHGNYQLVKRTKKIKIEGLDESVEIEFGELQKSGKPAARFGEDAGEPLTSVRFGSFEFLKGEEKHLVVEQRANKFWRYWIISLSPRLEVIHDSGKYDVVYEPRPADFDGDGNFEIVQHLGTFWYWNCDNVRSPRPPVIFAYDEGARRYVPANIKYQERLLSDINARIEKVREPGGAGGLCGALDVTIRYLYAGKESEAWEFFDQSCGECRTLDGREAIKAGLKKTLTRDALYQEIRKQSH